MNNKRIHRFKRSEPASCTVNGFTLVFCEVCGETPEYEIIDGCICFTTSSFSLFIIVDAGSLITTPDTDEVDDPSETSCDHLCHKNGIFRKILRFIFKFFGMNPVCECGEAHS